MAPLSEPAGHYPYQAPIEAYGNGGFRFAGMSHRGSLLCLPTGMFAWQVGLFSEISEASLQPLLEHSDALDVCLIGVGDEPALLGKELRKLFADLGIVVETVTTGGAVRTYNVLLAEQRAVAAALIAVDRGSR